MVGYGVSMFLSLSIYSTFLNRSVLRWVVIPPLPPSEILLCYEQHGPHSPLRCTKSVHTFSIPMPSPQLPQLPLKKPYCCEANMVCSHMLALELSFP